MRKCFLCGADLFENPILTLPNMPSSAQNIPNEKEIDQEEGISLSLCQCKGCGLVQFSCEPVGYFRDVIRSGGFSSTMVNLRRQQYKHLIDKYELQGKKFVEIGCGAGEFIKILQEFPVEVYGIEHNLELADKARQSGITVQETFLEQKDIRLENGPFDVFLSFNFLEHQPDPNGMLQGIYNNLTEEGMGLITVPSLEYILKQNVYYELIRDHLAYYTFDTLCFALDKNGFEILEKETINRDTLSVIVRKKKRLTSEGLSNSYKDISKEINTYVDTFILQGKKVAIWGASHQGFTIAATTRLQNKIEYIIDSAPFKQGLYAPASHIPIISPEKVRANPVDSIIIIAPGYAKEISDIIRKDFGSNIEIAVLKSKDLEVYKPEDVEGMCK